MLDRQQLGAVGDRDIAIARALLLIGGDLKRYLLQGLQVRILRLLFRRRAGHDGRAPLVYAGEVVPERCVDLTVSAAIKVPLVRN